MAPLIYNLDHPNIDAYCATVFQDVETAINEGTAKRENSSVYTGKTISTWTWTFAPTVGQTTGTTYTFRNLPFEPRSLQEALDWEKNGVMPDHDQNTDYSTSVPSVSSAPSAWDSIPDEQKQEMIENLVAMMELLEQAILCCPDFVKKLFKFIIWCCLELVKELGMIGLAISLYFLFSGLNNIYEWIR